MSANTCGSSRGSLIRSISRWSSRSRDDGTELEIELIWVDDLLVIFLTLLLLALPALLVVVLGKRANVFLPKARNWMNSNSWIISEIVLVFFVGITVKTLVG